MSNKKATTKYATSYERVIFSLPRSLVTELKTYATICRGGNKSGFVADSIEAYIKGLRRYRHTHKLRQAYATAAERSLAIAKEWEHLDDETWAQLDELEASRKT